MYAQQLIVRKDYINESDKITKQYVLSDSLITGCFGLLSKIDFKNIEMILVYSFYIDDIEKILKRINDFELPLKLDLKQSDSLAINSRFIQLFTDEARYRTIVGQMKQDVQYHFYKKAMQYKLEGKFNQALELFQRSIKAKKNYYPSYIDMADMYNKYGKIDEAIRVVQQVYNQQKPQGEEEILFKQFSDSLYFSFLRKASIFINSQQYNEALDVLNRAKDFSVINWVANKDTVVSLIKVARQGLFDSYIRIARKAIDMQKYYLAEPLILQADGYGYEYASYLKNIDVVTQLADKLIEGYFQLGKLYRKQGKQSKAFELFTRANALCGRFVKCKKCADIADVINVMKVVSPTISRSKIIRKDSVAPIIVKEEIKSAGIESITSTNNLLNLEIDSLVKFGSLKAWANELTTADRILNQVKRIQSENNLQDSSVYKAIADLENKMNTRRCLNVKYDYDEWLRKATFASKSIQYIDAFEYANKAIESAKNASICSQDSLQAFKLKEQVWIPVNYILQVNKSLDFLREKKYNDFFNLYSLAETVFYQKNIDTYGLAFKSISKQLISSYDKDAIVQGLSFVLHKGNTNEALQLLNYLQSIGYSAELTTENQVQLGQQLAERDKKKNPNANVDESIVTYTNNSKWYKSLRQSYVRKFKE